MKNLRYLILCFVPLLLFSCKKSSISVSPGYVKIFPSDSNWVAVNCFQLNDGNIYLFGADPYYNHSALMIKMSPNGVLIFEKYLPSTLNNILKVIPINNGNGILAVAGASPLNSTTKNAIWLYTYDQDGNKTDSNIFDDPNNKFNLGNPVDAIQNSDGSFALAGTSNDIFTNGTPIPALLMVSNSLTILNFLKFDTITNYFSSLNSNQNYPASISFCLTRVSNNLYLSGYLSGYIFKNNMEDNEYIIKTDLDGNFESFYIMDDSLMSESPACISFTQNDNIVTFGAKVDTGALVGDNTNGIGAWMEYRVLNSDARYSSGEIGFDLYSPVSNSSTRVNLPDNYPNNGILISAKPTRDGGVITIGTVGQLNNTALESQTQIYMLKLDNNLNYEWSKSINSPNHTYGFDIFPLQDGSGYILFGIVNSTLNNSNNNLIVIKTDINGDYY